MSGSIRLTGQMGVGLTGGGLRYPGVYAALDFAGAHYELSSRVFGGGANFPGFAITRASTATYFDPNGLLQTASSGTPRFSYDPVTLASLGILVEAAGTNVILWNRDLTNAAWTKSNITAAKDQVGIDGAANSASSITATAGNGTCLQAITLGSSVRQQSAWVKRLTGSGTVEMTTDNGTTWTAVTVTASWTRVTIPVQTLANPTVGFRIVTSGDAIAVDFSQNETGAGASSPIETTTASVTRSADVPSVTGLAVSATFSMLVECQIPDRDGADLRIASLSVSGASADRLLIQRTAANAARITSTVSSATTYLGDLAAQTGARTLKLGVSYGAAYAARVNGSALSVSVNTGSAPPVKDTLAVGQTGGTYLNGTISRIRIYNRALTASELQALTT